MNPMHEVKQLLIPLSDNNKDEQEAIGGYYELLAACRRCREACQYEWKIGKEGKEERVPKQIPEAIERVLAFVESIAKTAISEEKKHSNNLNMAQLMIDGIAAEAGMGDGDNDGDDK